MGRLDEQMGVLSTTTAPDPTGALSTTRTSVHVLLGVLLGDPSLLTGCD